MKIIASTDNGFLIEAKNSEVEEILRAVYGTIPDDIKIGQKIPAIDYAATITKLKSLPKEYEYRQLMVYGERFKKMMDELNDVVESATKL